MLKMYIFIYLCTVNQKHMKRKQIEQIKKVAPGRGRKPVENKVKMIPLYIRSNRLDQLGGESVVREMFNEFLNSI
jgi:hypothetical protein